MDPATAKRHVPEPAIFEYKARDAIIYALGIGATTKNHLKYLYENHEDHQVFPTFVVAPGLLANSLSDWPGVPFDLTRILHGEQYIEIFEPLPSDGQLRSETRVSEILDKGTGANILADITTYDNNTGKKLSFQQFGTFQVGSGNFGGKRTSEAERKAEPIPKRQPDRVVEEKVSVDQAALYRMGSGDLNPLHIDPTFAKMSGFKEPILHGLCSMGFAVRQVVDTFANGDGAQLKAVKVRFSSPVIPGQTLQTEMWKENTRIHFQTKVKETGKVVISNGYVDLKSDSKTAGHVQEQKSASSLQSQVIFDAISTELPNQKDVVKKVNGIILYEITQNGKPAAYYTLDLKYGSGSVYGDKPKNNEKPNVTVTVDDGDFVKIATGQLEPTKAFMSGKLKAKGNIMLLQKLQGIMAGAKASKL